MDSKERCSFCSFQCKGGVFMKKMVCIVIVLVLMLPTLTISISAESTDNNHNRYQYTHSCNSSLTISGNTASCSSDVRGYSGITTKIEITQCFEQLLPSGWWYRLKSWNKTFYGWYAYYDNSTTVTESGTYHVRTVAKVYSGSNYETIAIYSNNVTV